MKTALHAVLLTLALVACPALLIGQTLDDASRRDALIRRTVAGYEAALIEQQPQPPAPAQLPSPGAGGTRELRLEEAVALALEKNLDIAVERLNPQAVDLHVAGLHNTYRPVATSTVATRQQFQLPNSQLVGGQRVSADRTTYNAGIAQNVPWLGGNVSLLFNNFREESTSNNVLYNPQFQSSVLASYNQPLLRGFKIDNVRQQLLVTQISQDIAEENVRGTVAATIANVRNAYWDLVFARSAVDVARRSLQLAEKLVEDNRVRVEIGTLAPIDIVQAEVQAANNQQTLALAEATLQTAQLSLKRFLVNGTEDPLWVQEILPVDLPSLAPPPADLEGSIRNALSRRTDLQNARKNIDSTDVSIRFFRNQALPAVDLLATYGAQGIGGNFLDRTPGIGGQVNTIIPGSYADALSVLGARDYPNWNVQFTVSYPIGASQADAQYARARVQRQQAVTRLRALEVQVAAEVATAALTVQSNLKRIDAARAARELAQQQLEAEQSKFEVGMSTNFFVVQAQRDLANAENVELRALSDYRKSLVTFERSQEAPAGGGTGTGAGSNTNTTTGTGNTTTGTGAGAGGPGGPGGAQ
ncbi:MAG: TolC family protein [Vicinamibacterales bacterium]